MKKKQIVLVMICVFVFFSVNVDASFVPYDTLSFGGKLDATTAGDTTIPLITINFAGNLSDSGGPYWRPPEESTQLTGVWSDGYYTNDSMQHENFTCINLTIIEPESDLTSVYLNWYNQSSDTWIYDTYSFSNMTGGFWEINTSEHFDVYSGHNYSFNINATSSGGTNWTAWNKTGIGEYYTRRYVQLNCTPEDVTYTTFYFVNTTYKDEDKFARDAMQHDQGPDATLTDTCFLDDTIPTDTIEMGHCGTYVGYWFNADKCPKPFTLENIYLHFWWNSTWDASPVLPQKSYWQFSRMYLTHYLDYHKELYVYSETDERSRIQYEGRDYHLEARVWNVTNVDITDNNIYEFVFSIYRNARYPSLIHNQSFKSWIFFNVPDNVTLNGLDSDSDSLSDYDELYTYHTHPFLSDTDNDGVSDYDESLSGSDPNNYTDTQSPAIFTPYDTLSFGGKLSATTNSVPTFANEAPTNQSNGLDLTPTMYIVVSDADSDTTTCDFYTGTDGIEFGWRQTNLVVASGTNISYTFQLANNYSTTYYWKVTANDGADNSTSEIYQFTTKAASSFSAYDTLSFGGKVTVNEGTINIDVAPDIWDAGNPACGNSATENFTFYQNGSATIDTKIGFNKTNYTFVNYATWLGNGHDQYCANFTIDTWGSETNIAVKVGGDPVTTLKTSVSGNSNFGFGIRIYMPKTVSTANLREDFKVMFNATIS